MSNKAIALCAVFWGRAHGRRIAVVAVDRPDCMSRRLRAAFGWGYKAWLESNGTQKQHTEHKARNRRGRRRSLSVMRRQPPVPLLLARCVLQLPGPPLVLEGIFRFIAEGSFSLDCKLAYL